MGSRGKPRLFIGLFGATAMLFALASLATLRPTHDRSIAQLAPPPRFASDEARRLPQTAAVAKSVPVPFATAPAIPLASSRSASELRGTVRDLRGRPVAHAVVRSITLTARADTETGGESAEVLAMTNELGVFVARVSPGDYAIFATERGRSSALVEPISVVPGEAVDELDLVLEGSGHLAGLVVDTAGRPAKALLTLRRPPHGGRFFFSSTTSSDGRFTVDDLPVVAFDLEVRDRKTGAFARVHLDRPQDNVVLRLGQAPGELDVRVSDELGAPIDGATVMLDDVDGSSGAIGFTGGDGRTRLHPRATRVRVSATTDDGSSDPIELELDERQREVALRVERRGSVRGRILLPLGAPASGTVSLIPLEHTASNAAHEMELDVTGAFRFSPLPRGRYEIRYEGSELLGEAITQAFTIVAREERVLPDLRPRGGRTVAGFVVDESGDPVAGADVAVIDGRAESLGHGVTTDASGRFTLTGQVFGAVSVRAEGEGVVSAITLLGEREESVTLVARGIGHVTGMLRGKLTADARVRCTDGLWHPVDDRGQYALSCPPGSTIEVEASGVRRSFPVELEEEEQTYLELRL